MKQVVKMSAARLVVVTVGRYEGSRPAVLR